MSEILTAVQKAFALNLDPDLYGSIAEIGAGQEVARYFFLAGGAAGTIARTISAYDMHFSDASYGEEPSGRYVSESRLNKMLEKEYGLVLKRVGTHRQKNSSYFAFADTVTARSYKRKSAECHGWMGIHLQLYPGAPPSKVNLHVRMLDESNRQQQEALGILGVNLIYAVYNYYRKPEKLIASLRDNLGQGRVEVDTIRLEGPYFEELDARLTALLLVETNLTDAVMFSPKKEVLQPSEILYKKNVLVLRSCFAPVTKVTLDMIKCGKENFLGNPDVKEENCVVLPELSTIHLKKNGVFDKKSFLHRIDTVTSLGHPVLVTDYLRYFRVREFLNRYTKNPVGFILGIPNMELLFDDTYYEGLEGGILGAFSKLFDGQIKLFVYPMRKANDMISVDNFPTPDHLKYLYLHLRENNLVESVENYDKSILHIWPQGVLKKLRKGRGDWESMVPENVAREIIKHRMFGFDSA